MLFFHVLSKHVIYLNMTEFSFLQQVGLLYDDESLRSIIDMIADWTSNEREMLRRQVP